MPHDIRFVQTPDTFGGTNFDGTPGNFYAEEYNVGTTPSSKSRRFDTDKDIADVNLSDLTSITTGYKVSYTSQGVEVTTELFDGRKSAELFKITYDYNSPDAYIVNGLIDGVDYRTPSNPETWINLTFTQIFENLLIRRVPNANFDFNAAEWNAATENGGSDKYAGAFSFRGTPLPQAIDELVRRHGNVLWWVEQVGTRWLLKFKKRDLSGVDPKYAKVSGAPTGLNVVGLDLEGPASNAHPTGRVFDQGDGWKVQVGGPCWIGGVTSPNATSFQEDGSPPPPVRFQLEISNSTVNKRRSANTAIIKAAKDAGHATPSNSAYLYYGWSSLAAKIGDLQNDSSLDSVAGGKQVKNFHKLAKADSNGPVVVEIHTPVTNNPHDNVARSTRWYFGMTPPSGSGDFAFPVPPPPRNGSPNTQHWKVGKNLLTHPNASVSVEVATSRTPTISFLRHYNMDDTDEAALFSKDLADQQAYVAGVAGKTENGEIVAKGYVETYDFQTAGSQRKALATILFYRREYKLLAGAKIDATTGLLIIRTEDFANLGDWSAWGRGSQANVPSVILRWVSDGTKYQGASDTQPQPLIFISLDKALETVDRIGSTRWGQEFVIHCTFTYPIPFATSPVNGPAPYVDEIGHYEVHNVRFNAAGVPGYPEPPTVQEGPQNDFTRMLDRAAILNARNDPKWAVKGRYQIFPGDATNIKLGVFTNGGVITKVRHDFIPYFRTQFWLEGSLDVDELGIVEERQKINDVKNLIQIGNQRLSNIERSLSESANNVGSSDQRPNVKAAPGLRGFDLGVVEGGVEVRPSVEDTTNDQYNNIPDIYLRGQTKRGPLRVTWNSFGQTWFSGGLAIDNDPTANSFGEKGNFSSPIVLITNKDRPTLTQKVGYSHNLFALVRLTTDTGYDDGENFRSSLNISDQEPEYTKLLNAGGDRLNIRDAFLKTGNVIQSLERAGELSSFITKDQFFTTRIHGTAPDFNWTILGLTRENRTGNTFTYLDGAQTGLGYEVGKTKSYRFVVHLRVGSTDSTDSNKKIFTDGYPKDLGLYIGPHTTTPDNSGGLNTEYWMVMSAYPKTGRLPSTFYDKFETIQTGGLHQHRHKTDFGLGLVVLEQSVTALSFASGGEYTPTIKHTIQYDYLLNDRLIVMSHGLFDTATGGAPKPLFQIDHGRNRSNIVSSIKFLESSFLTSLRLFGHSDPFTPRFETTLGNAYFAVIGDLSRGSLIFSSSECSLAFGKLSTGKVKLEVQTGPRGWRTFASYIRGSYASSGSGGTLTLELYDSNEERFDTYDVPISSVLNWPGDATIGPILPFTFAPTTDPVNKNRAIWVTDPQWVDYGISVPGAGSFVGSNIQFGTTVYPGIMTRGGGTPETVERLAENVADIVNAHNRSMFNLRALWTSFAGFVAKIFGVEIENAVGDQVSWNRKLSIMKNDSDSPYYIESAPIFGTGGIFGDGIFKIGRWEPSQGHSGITLSPSAGIVIETGSPFGSAVGRGKLVLASGKLGQFHTAITLDHVGQESSWILNLQSENGFKFGVGTITSGSGAISPPAGLYYKFSYLTTSQIFQFAESGSISLFEWLGTTGKMSLGILPTAKILLRVNTNGTWKTFGSDISVSSDAESGQITVTLLDSNNDPLGSGSTTPIVRWPADGAMLFANPPFAGNHTDPIFCQSPKIWEQQDYWKQYGIGVAGAANWQTATYGSNYTSYPGVWTRTAGGSTVVRLAEFTQNLANAHNALAGGIYRLQQNIGRLAAAIFGPQAANAQGAGVSFDRQLHILETNSESPFTIQTGPSGTLPNVDYFIVGRKRDWFPGIGEHGIRFEAANAAITIATGLPDPVSIVSGSTSQVTNNTRIILHHTGLINEFTINHPVAGQNGFHFGFGSIIFESGVATPTAASWFRTMAYNTGAIRASASPAVSAFEWNGVTGKFACGLFGTKSLFKVNTNGTWKTLAAKLVGNQAGNTVTIEIQDTNDDIIGNAFSFTTGGGNINWPQDAALTFNDTQFFTEGSFSKNKNPLIWDDQAFWRRAGVYLPGTTWVANTTVYGSTYTLLFGDMTIPLTSTVERIASYTIGLANAHNLLTVSVQRLQQSLGALAATIFGAEAEGAGASGSFNKYLAIDLTGGSAAGAGIFKINTRDSGGNALVMGLRSGFGGFAVTLNSVSMTSGFTSVILQPTPARISLTADNASGGGISFEITENFVGCVFAGPTTVPVPFTFDIYLTGNSTIGYTLNLRWLDIRGAQIGNDSVALPGTSGGGSTGPTGPTGPRGLQGPPGSGSRGPTGLAGEKGEKGEKGEDGKQGPPGPKGKTGPTGATGERGFVGSPGPTGVSGDPGPTGPTGPPGPPGSGVPCCVISTPSEPLTLSMSGPNKFLFYDAERNEETLLLQDFVGSYDMSATHGVAATPTTSKTFETIENDYVIRAGSIATSFVDVRSTEYRGLITTQPVPGPLGEITPVDPDIGTTYSSAVDSGLVLYKGPVPLVPDRDFSIIKPSIVRTTTRVAVSAIQFASRFGGCGGVANTAHGATSNQSGWPEVNPRSSSHDNSIFIRNLLRLATRAPELLIDGAGRWALSAGSYILPTAIDSSGNIIVNSDSNSRVNYTGIQGSVMGALKDLAGIELRPDKILSRRAFGVVGVVSRITGAGGGVTTQDVIVNNFGIHGAIQGNDGEYPDVYMYDKSIAANTIAFGGDIGKVRRQINRCDGLVATGNSGLWTGGGTFIASGDSVEEAVTKLDNQLYKCAHYETTFTATVAEGSTHTETITHNLRSYPQISVMNTSSGRLVIPTITYTSTNAITVRVTTSGTYRVICDTNNKTL